jgi:signal transduction histidine kinase
VLRSIRGRLVASYVLLAVLAVSLVGVLAVAQVRQSLQQQEYSALLSNAEAIARQALPRLSGGTRLGGLDQLAQAAAFLGSSRVRILDARMQTVIADSGPNGQSGEVMWVESQTGEVLGIGKVSDGGAFILLPSGKTISLPPGTPITSIYREDGPWGGQLRFGSHPNQPEQVLHPADAASLSTTVVMAPIGSAEKPLGYVELSGGPGFSSQAVAATQSAFLWAALVAALAAAVVGLFVSRSLTAPLTSLGAAATRMSTGDLSARAPAGRQDELGQLAGQFNLMAERLQGSFNDLAAERDALRRFVADASHELRTPITALQTFTDLLEGPASQDAAARAQFLAESQVQLGRLEWITRNLLDLSRLDAGIESLDLATQDAADLTRCAAGPYQLQAKEKGIQLWLDLPESGLDVRCDQARLEIALSNLIQNALKFTPSGGMVRIHLEAMPDGVRWTVEDNGPGIAPQDLPLIFDRFYRAGQPGVEGSGLGLAIVKSIIQAHGGQVEVHSQPGAGSQFIIQLPFNP